MRFFRVNIDSEYETARLALDDAWGLPDSAGTLTSIIPAAIAARGNDSKIVFGLCDVFLLREPVGIVVQDLLDAAAISEITQADYFAALAKDFP